MDAILAQVDKATELLKDQNVLMGVVTTVVVLLGFIIFYQWQKGAGLALRKSQWRNFKLSEKEKLSHNAFRFRFDLQTPTTVLGLPIGQHITFQAHTPDGKEITRPYTPVSLDSDLGHVDFVIKIYPTGAMSQHLAKLNVGDYLAMRGPKGKFKYTRNMVNTIGMIAGGTGITPMFQVARRIFEDPMDRTAVRLISANVTEDDILLRDVMNTFLLENPGRFSVFYTLNNPPEKWRGGVGFVTKEMVQARIPPPAHDVMVLYCGPPAMNKAVEKILLDLGYLPEMIFKF